MLMSMTCNYIDISSIMYDIVECNLLLHNEYGTILHINKAGVHIQSMNRYHKSEVQCVRQVPKELNFSHGSYKCGLSIMLHRIKGVYGMILYFYGTCVCCFLL